MDDQDARARAGLLFDAAWPPYRTFKTRAHPLLASERRHLTYPDGHTGGAEYGDPVVIEDRVWLGANVTVMPGVTIGHDVVVGADSLVTHDVPAGWLAFGTPARPVREITAADSVHSPTSAVYGRLNSQRRPAGVDGH